MTAVTGRRGVGRGWGTTGKFIRMRSKGTRPMLGLLGSRVRVAVAVMALSACAAVIPLRAVPAQTARVDLGGSLLPGGEEARYLRSLQLLDTVRSALVGVQATGAGFDAAWRRVVRGSAAHPWAARFGDGRQRVFTLLRPDVDLIHQTGLITADVPGVTWAGLGLTATAQAGVHAEWKWLRAQVAPVVFWTQNRGMALTPNGLDRDGRFRDSRFPGSIDLPQRFGPDSYSRFDWGDSFVELSAVGVAVGVSNARQQWGPAQHYPLVLGTGSGGFAHGYVGSSTPMNIGIGVVHGRLILGRLEQSEYSPTQSGETARFLSGVVMSFSPKLISGFELGATRLVNGPWPEGGAGWSEAMLPFEGIINNNVSELNQNPYNGFASVFVRVAPPRTGLEAFAELSREDFAGNVRWLLMEPDDLTHLTVGIGHARTLSNGQLRRVTFELTNGEVAHTERAARALNTPFPPYLHSGTYQGLTNRGQLLGSLATFGGAGAIVSVDYYSERGRNSVSLERTTLLDWIPHLGATGGVSGAEVRYGVRVEALRFAGARDIGISFGPSYTLNRSLEPGDDRWGLELGIRWRGW